MKLKNARPFNPQKISDLEIYDVELFTTLNNTEEDLWLQLDRLTNRSQAVAFLSDTLSDRKKAERIAPVLCEFIRQGKTYFMQAEQADLAVSPLLYYYGMLNLVKAFILSRNPYLITPKVGKNFHQKILVTAFRLEIKLRKNSPSKLRT